MSGFKGSDSDSEDGDVRDEDAGLFKVSLAVLTIGGALIVGLIASALAEIVHQGWMIADVAASEKAHDAADRREFDDFQKQLDRRINTLSDQLATGRKERLDSIAVLEHRVDDLERRYGVEHSR